MMLREAGQEAEGLIMAAPLGRRAPYVQERFGDYRSIPMAPARCRYAQTAFLPWNAKTLGPFSTDGLAEGQPHGPG
jgi:hypothetical protein